jgi:hypothetical protein
MSPSDPTTEEALRITAAVTAFTLTMTTFTQAQWKPAEAPLMTEWAAKVDPAKPLPEYPRPQLGREQWENLNGLWDYAIVGRDDAKPTKFDGQILVPFCIESALSGVGKRVSHEQSLWYRRSFASPKANAGERTILHFGGVDWQATVFVNGQQVAEHKGGHTPFSADITAALKSTGENELVVKVWDPTDFGSQPRGKQIHNPHGIWYTPVTGIWQTVWTETVPAASIKSLKLTPDVDAGTLTIQSALHGSGDVFDVEVTALDGEKKVATATGKSDGSIQLKVDNAKLWSPDSPFLYDLQVTLKKDGKSLDTVKSYFAMRKVSLGKDAAGYQRLMLNNKPLFQFGPLDQGWWPDGLYTAPTDEALKWDIQFTKDLGFNMCRKHIKVEPARWYYHADKLGLMVWQDQSSGMQNNRDMGVAGGRPNDAVFTPIEQTQFIHELTEMIDTLHNSPSVVAWVPFNEGWGQHDTNDVLKWVKAYDPTRLVDGPSGWEDRGFGDMKDMHNYPGPGMFPLMDDRASVLGEYGGLGLPVEGHLWQNNDNWGYRTYKDKEELARQYKAINDRLIPLARRGLAAAVYTQTTDVEGEVNGFATYDRKVIKYDLKSLAQQHADAIKAGSEPVKTQELVPTSEKSPQTYLYTFEKPADGWEKADANVSNWKSGNGTIGSRGTPNTKIGTEWTTPEIWVRRTVKLDKKPAGEVFIRIRHDEDAEIYINGVKAASLRGFVDFYSEDSLSKEAVAALRQGENVIAVYVKQTVGGQAIDFGLGEYVPVK